MEEEIFSSDELIIYFLLEIRIYLHIYLICKRLETAGDRCDREVNLGNVSRKSSF